MARAASVLTVVLVGFVAGALGYLAGGGFLAVGPPAPPAFAGAPPSFAEIVERVNSAVVHVDVIEDARSGAHGEFGDGPPLGLPRRGEGSGFIVDSEGYILTNHHLVPGPARVRVRLADKRELVARRVGSDASTDLALLKVEARGLPAVPLGDSDRLRVGDWVCAIGNPLEFDHTVTVGVVSSKGRKIFNESFDSYIQTDAAINPGSSGGPLVNLRGEAVGISAAISSEAEGIGFAIPSNVARAVLVQLREEGRVRRAFLGVQLHELDPDLAAMMGLSEVRGALVVDVPAGEAAAVAGLRPWDVITEVAGEPIANGDELIQTISALPPGHEVRLSLLRDGEALTVSARLGERIGDPAPEPDLVRPAASTPAEGDALGLVVGNLGARTRAELGLPPNRVGVVIRSILGVDPGTDDLEEGDLVVSVNRRATPDVTTYREVLSSLRRGQSAWLYVHRPVPAGSFLTRVEVERAR
ncbi:MAG: trypsin-like peptidase domain-containing protein [Acidobacteria bacterium]|nr:trypsin-like peptidase domain-containing protein [Acidobacteriota bacterium]